MGKETRLEKAIRGLKAIENIAYERWVHSQNTKDELVLNIEKYMPDAISLLKAQEPKPPVIKENAYGWKFFYCPSCDREFYADRKHGRVNKAKFCDKCGRAVKWG